MEEKMIGGISISKWKEAFLELCEIGIEKDYFSDILFFDLYPDIPADAKYSVYQEKWNYTREALKAIFKEEE